MARSRGRSVGDVAKYTGARSTTPPSFRDDQDDDSVTSGATFALISIAVFVAIAFFAVRFGTQNIENDLETRAANALASSGFDLVEVEASGATVNVRGSYVDGQDPEDAYAIVAGVSGVGSVEGEIWLIDTDGANAQIVRGAFLEATWENGVATISGTLSTDEKIAFVNDSVDPAASSTFLTVNTEGLAVKEGLVDEAWVGPSLGLLHTVAAQLPVGYMRVDGDAKVVAISGEVEERDLRDTLNGAVLEMASGLGFSPTPGILLLDDTPTEEEVEELQEDLNALILDQVVEFEVKSYQLTEQGTELLDEVLVALQGAPEGIRVVIAGHTDDRGPDSENMLLSEQRARAVLDYLVANGQDPERFDIIGYGESQPVESNATEDGRARNRRIEFTALFVELEGEDQ
jgi:OOP family OmpA-OmpF porin